MSPGRRPGLVALVTLGVAALVACPAHATVGGPSLVTRVGLETTEKALYCQVSHFHGGDQPADWWVFDLASAHAGAPRRVAGLTPTGEDDRAAVYARLGDLWPRLQPLPVPADWDVRLEVTTVAADSVDWFGYRIARSRVRVRVTSGDLRAETELTVYVECRVGLARLYAIPGDRRRLAILTSTGIAGEGGYDVESPLLLEAVAAPMAGPGAKER